MKILLYILLIFGVYFKYQNLDTQFSTTDDTGVAWTLIEHIKDIDNSYIQKKIVQQQHEDFHSLQYFILRNFDINIFKPILKLFIIPQTWTYAPMQFVITQFFLNDDLTYKDLIFWGRLPSFIFSISSMIMIILIMKNIYKNKWLYPCLTTLIVYNFSLENLIYSAHMSNYASSCFSVLSVIYIFLKITNFKFISLRNQIFYGLFLALSVCLAYQAIFIIPLLFIYLCFSIRINKPLIYVYQNIEFKYIVSIFIYFCLFSLITYIPFLVTQINRGNSISTGVPEKYYFPTFFSNTNIVENLYECIKFFAVNIFDSINFLFSFQYSFSFLSLIYTVLILIFILYSFTFLNYKIKSQLTHAINILTLSFISFLFLVLLHKIPFSPTRHILFLLPIYSILFTIGIHHFFKKIHKKSFKNIKLIYITSFIILFFFFMKDINNFNKDRKELVDYDLMQKYISRTNPQLIVIPNYFLLNKLLPKNYIKDISNYKDGYSTYILKNLNIKNIKNILVIKLSDNYYKYTPGNSNHNFKLVFEDLISTRVYLDIAPNVKSSINQVSFIYFKSDKI